MSALHVAIVGAIAGDEVTPLLHGEDPWPTGNGASHLVTLIAELLQRGHRVTAITLAPELPLAAHFRVQARGPNFAMVWCPMRRDGWAFNRVQRHALGGWFGWLPGRRLDGGRFERHALRDALLDAAPDLVHAHGLGDYARAALDSRRPHLITCDDDPARVPQPGAARRVLRRAQALTAASPWLAERLRTQAAAVPRCVPHPLRNASFAMRQKDEAGRRRVLVVASGLTPAEVCGAMLAFAAVSNRAPVAELVLLGAGLEAGGAAEAWWKEQGLRGRVRFVGAQNHAEVQHWLVHSDVLLHPGRDQAFGLVVAEALAVGLPVVAAQDGGAVPWLADGAALLVDATDPSALAAAVIRVWQDPVAAADRAARGRASVRERLAAPVVGAAYEAIYREVLGAARAP